MMRWRRRCNVSSRTSFLLWRNAGYVTSLEKRRNDTDLPLAGLFLDWFPVMKGHYGHKSTQEILSRRYRELYAACDLAFCTSDGMQEMLGPASQQPCDLPHARQTSYSGKVLAAAQRKIPFVYVGSVENFYGRMLCSLIEKIEATAIWKLSLSAQMPTGQSNFLSARGQAARISASSHQKKPLRCWPVPTRCYL